MICPICKTEFVGRPNKIYCSPRCKRRQKKRARTERHCQEYSGNQEGFENLRSSDELFGNIISIDQIYAEMVNDGFTGTIDEKHCTIFGRGGENIALPDLAGCESDLPRTAGPGRPWPESGSDSSLLREHGEGVKRE